MSTTIQEERYRAKCLSCRRTAEGSTINEACLPAPSGNMVHHELCEAMKGKPTKFDCIDLRIASDF